MRSPVSPFDSTDYTAIRRALQEKTETSFADAGREYLRKTQKEYLEISKIFEALMQ